MLWAFFQLIFELIKNSKMVLSLLFIFHALVKHENWFELTLSLFHALDSNMKKVLSALYTFRVLVKNSVNKYRVYFYYFLDSLKLDYEKRNPNRVLFKLFLDS